jgi:hypothetical protein
MAITIQSARASAPVIAPTNGASKTRLSDGTIAYTTTAALNSAFHIVFGSSVGAPATFAGFAHALDNLLNATDRLSVVDAGPRQAYNVLYSGLSFAAFTVGDRLWVGIFENPAALLAGDVPDAVFDMGLIVA